MTRGGIVATAVLLGLVGIHGRAAAQLVRAAGPACPAIAITFDMCPVRTGGFDAPLIETLRARRIPATFFLSGRWMQRHERELDALLGVPFFEIGTHGETHAHLRRLGAAGQREEILAPIEWLRARRGLDSRLFRPPYGEHDEVTLRLARELGLRVVLWSAVSGDPDPHLTAARMAGLLRERLAPGGIVVFHANGKGRHTREALELLYEDLTTRRGLRPLTVSELLEACPPLSPPAPPAGAERRSAPAREIDRRRN